MSFHSIIESFLGKDLPRSVEIFAPEIVLCAVVVLLLFWRMFDFHHRIPTSWVALFGTLFAFLGVFAQFLYLKSGGTETGSVEFLFDQWRLSSTGVGQVGPYFTGMLIHDPFAVFFRMGLTLFLALVIALTILTGIPDSDDGQDFYTLLIGATIGMMLCVGTNHLMMMFLSIEMMSVPSYLIVAFQKGRKQATEASLKYVVYGAGMAGVMLYGISLIAGLLGTATLPVFANRFALLLDADTLSMTSASSLTLVFAILMVLSGIAFKLALVPFHFWCPDAFEGASAEVGGFLSVASKAAAFALLVRFALAFHGENFALDQLGLLFGVALGVIAAVTMTFGNLAAYTQTNLKRLLAYSTIAQAGYMLMAVSAMLVIVSSAPAESAIEQTATCIESLVYYIVVYLFMNLTAFAIVAFVRNERLREDIAAYKGLFNGSTSTKVICICLAISFFSLIGIPPFGGFFAKMMVFYSTLQSAQFHWFLWVVLVLGGLNTVFSVFYYLNVLRTIFITEADPAASPVTIPAGASMYVALVTLPIVAFGMSSLQHDLTVTAHQIALTLLR